MMRQPAASCLKDCQTTAPSLLLRLQPPFWHWTTTGTYMGPVHHNVVVYSDSMSCLQAIDGEDTENPFICYIMNLLWSLSDKDTSVHFCWIPSYCGIGGNERVDPTLGPPKKCQHLTSNHPTSNSPYQGYQVPYLVQRCFFCSIWVK